MIKSVSRSTGLSVCLIIVLIVPLIQCSSIENEESSIGRFKRSAFSEISAKTSENARSSVESLASNPLELFEKGGKSVGWGEPGETKVWPGAGGSKGWPGAGEAGVWGEAGGFKGWPNAGGSKGWPNAGGFKGWPGFGSWPGTVSWGNKPNGWEDWGAGSWGAKKEGSLGSMLTKFIPALDKTFVPAEESINSALTPVSKIVDKATSIFGFDKGFDGKEGFEKLVGPNRDYSRVLTSYLATQQLSRPEIQPNDAIITSE